MRNLEELNESWCITQKRQDFEKRGEKIKLEKN